MKLRTDHPFYTACNDIDDIIKPLNQLGITYFSYMKSDHKGGRIYLYNNIEILDSYLTNKYYLRGNKESNPANYQKQICLWSTLPNQYEYDENVRSRGVDHGMFMFEPNSKSLEVFGFAAQKENIGIINTYLTNLDLLKKFTLYFKEKASTIIKAAERNKIILPFHNNKLEFTNDVTSSDLDNNLLLQNSSLISNLLSKRQIDCCSLLLQGKTSREIADILCLSVRTVEYYMANIKIKMNCKNKAELIVKLSKFNCT